MLKGICLFLKGRLGTFRSVMGFEKGEIPYGEKVKDRLHDSGDKPR